MAEGPAGLKLLGSGSSGDMREIFAGHNEKVAAVLDQLRQGDYGQLSVLMGISLDDTVRAARPPLAELRRTLGEWKESSVLGSVLLGGNLLTYARLNFERGARFAELLWERPAVEAAGYSGPPAAAPVGPC